MRAKKGFSFMSMTSYFHRVFQDPLQGSFPIIRNPWMLAGVCVVVFLLAMVLYTWSNDFPPRYHTDEPTKVRQVQSGDFNFLHPQLMLNGARAVLFLKGAPPTTLNVGIAGRQVSAFLSALGMVLLCLLGYRFGGVLAAACAGGAGVLSHGVMVYAHFMKEDATFMFGFLFALWTAGMFLDRPSLKRALLVGLGCGVAVSAKYMGAIMIPVGLGVVLSRGWRPARVFGVLGVCAAVFALVNYPALMELPKFFGGVAYEAGHAVTGHYGEQLPFPNWLCLRGIWKETPKAILIFVAVYYIVTLREWKSRSAFEKLFACAPLLILVPLMLSKLYSSRYLVPLTALLYAMGGLGLWEFCRRLALKPRLRYGVLIGCFLAFTIFAGLKIGKLLYYFEHDGRAQLQKVIEETLPIDAYIAQDEYASLPPDLTRTDGVPFQNKVEWHRFSGELGSLREAAQKGVTHIAVCNRSYDRFFRAGAVSAEYQDEYRRMREFYEELFADAKLLWRVKLKPGFSYMKIELRLYEIPQKYYE